jgi:hypothetical protein
MITIRRYQPGDNGAVRELHVLALQPTGAIWDDGPWDQDLENIEGVYLANRGEFLVGTQEDRLVAMGALRCIDDTRAEIKRMRFSTAGLWQADPEQVGKPRPRTRLHLSTPGYIRITTSCATALSPLWLRRNTSQDDAWTGMHFYGKRDRVTSPERSGFPLGMSPDVPVNSC